ncbi:ABC transporter permease [Paracoccus sp. S-4012]|uniref:ABC transporter permease n=1 Tax=Paracoccus sp. S-4012 TaxID=2665648 RepID=UPI001E5FE93F|nr:ABC transporter permease [Paracoccus sp. S-4012]
MTPLDFAVRYTAVLILALIVVIFGIVAPAFLAPGSLMSTLKAASFIGIAAVGMVFVLLTAGIDLSVGSAMYLAPVIAGIAMQRLGIDVAPALLLCLLVGAAIGLVNAILIVRLRIVPFIATLAMLFLVRGLGIWSTGSRQIDFPASMRAFGQSALFGIPMPVIAFAIVAAAAHIVLAHTAFGRHIYAFGNDAEAARKAGLPVRRMQAAVYVICSTCAALAGFVLISQIGRIDAGFGEGREFDVITAAVLGGASLFGGIGSAVSAVLGAVTVQAVKAGLVYAGVNLYLQPIVQGAIIFLAVFLDGLRAIRMEKQARRSIRPLA